MMMIQRDDPRWTVGEEGLFSQMKTQMNDKDAMMALLNRSEAEARYRARMTEEPWRSKGLAITAVCRCETATPCFEHTVYLADTRTMAQDLLDRGDAVSTEKAKELFLHATNFYLKLTDI